jgi:hypothetical protein
MERRTFYLVRACDGIECRRNLAELDIMSRAVSNEDRLDEAVTIIVQPKGL